MWVFVLFLALSTSYAGRENFPYGLFVEWSFPDDDSILFTYNIPELVYSTWAWAGFGLKYGDEKDLSMGHSDLYTVYFDGHQVDDRYGLGNAHPPKDIEEGCTSDINVMNVHEENGMRRYSFLRRLDTFDSADIVLKKNEGFIIMWAVGQSFDGGPTPHVPWNRGRQFAVLSEDYFDDGTDNYKGDGDGSYVEPPGFFSFT